MAVLQRLQGTGEQRTPAHVDSKKRRYSGNETKLPVKEFDTDRTARDRARSLCKMCDAAAREMK